MNSLIILELKSDTLLLRVPNLLTRCNTVSKDSEIYPFTLILFKTKSALVKLAVIDNALNARCNL